MTALACVSVTSCRSSLSLLERTSYSAAQLSERLPALRVLTGADQLAVLSTCERTELYAFWSGEPDPDALVAALASDKGLPHAEVTAAAARFLGTDAVRHLFRVATGLESFVIGEKDIVGQVRAAVDLGRAAATHGLELDRLLAAAVSTSRRAHRQTGFAEAGRSVGTAAVDAVAAMRGTLAGCRLLVVGAGEMATAVVEKACLTGASVTVCNRTRRRASRFIGAGAAVVDLAELGGCLATADVVIVGTSAPHPLIDRPLVERHRPPGGAPLLIVDLSLPRNVDGSVRGVSDVRVVDLADLRATGAGEAGSLARDTEVADRIVDAEVTRFWTWLAGRPAAAAVRRLRADSEAVVREELERLREVLPEEVHELVEQGLVRTVRRLTHGPTRELLAAAEAGGAVPVDRLAAMFAPQGPRG